jgi:hypothetical protein
VDNLDDDDDATATDIMQGDARTVIPAEENQPSAIVSTDNIQSQIISGPENLPVDGRGECLCRLPLLLSKSFLES